MATTQKASNTAELLGTLAHRLRKERVESEERTSSTLFSASAKRSDDEVFARAGLETIDLLESQGPGAELLAGFKLPQGFKVVQSVRDSVDARIASVAFRSNKRFAGRLRAMPAVAVAPVTWLYPQNLIPLGIELQRHEVVVPGGAQGKSLVVRVSDALGAPLGGVLVSAVVDVAGTNIAERTNAGGLATLRVPTKFPNVEVVLVTPDHSYWPKFVEGFARADFPTKPLEVTLSAAWPDSFALLGRYAGAKPAAGEGVTVGVIDCGVGPHDDLRVDGGFNVVSGEAAADFHDNGIGHGTHVAGIIAGRAAGGTGMLGVAPNCALRSYRVCSRTGESSTKAKSADVAGALNRAINDGCDLVNISLGSKDEMTEVAPLIRLAREKGTVVFAAMGNDGLNMARYPARYDDALGVSALGRVGAFPSDSTDALTGKLAEKGDEFVPEYSNHGIWTDFIGPGHAIVSTFPQNRYAAMSGTSMATPFVTGMAARFLSGAPDVLKMARSAARTQAILKLTIDASKLIGFPGNLELEGKGLMR